MSKKTEIKTKLRKCFDTLFPADTRRRSLARTVYRALRGTAVEKAAAPKYETDLHKPVKLPLLFAKEADPVVSVIISARNRWEYIVSCLSTLLRNSVDIPYEVILIVDNSIDKITQIEKSILNVTALTKPEKPGFAENYSHAAKLARGRYLLLLSDTVNPQKNWLAPLVNLVDSNDDVGMVGSKQICLGGTLREAGGIIWQDGGIYHYGRGDNPEKPEYNYVKEADFISLGSIMIKKQLWQEIGGFDSRYRHLDYPVVDLAFEVRKRGYKVIFQPQSVVLELADGCSAEGPAGADERQETDKTMFREKWAEVLKREHCLDERDIFKARDRSSGKKTLLLVDYMIPLYDQFAGSRTIFQYLKMFKDMNLNVKFIGENPEPVQPYTDALLQYGIEVLYGDYSLEKFADWIKENGRYIDYTYLHKPDPAAKFIDLIKKYTGSKIIYNVADLHWVRLERQYALDNDQATLASAKSHKDMEFKIFAQSDVILTYSDYEKSILAREFPDKKTVVTPLFIYEGKFPLGIGEPNTKREYITFVGGFAHKPNADGILWFINDIWPYIIKEIPQAKIKIIGSNPPVELLEMNSEAIEVTGFVSDRQLEEYYAKTKVIVAPLRFGAGVKGKVVEAVAYGIPVVTTEVGAEGFVGKERVLSVRNDAEAFASEVIALMKLDEEQWQEKHAACIEYARKYFSAAGAREIIVGQVLN